MTNAASETISPLLLETISEVRSRADLPPVKVLSPQMRLREDLQMDSLALAELTVHLEFKTGIDVFAQGLVSTIAEINQRLNES